MGLSRAESITSSFDNHPSCGDNDTECASPQDELERLRVSKKQIEIKLQLLKKRYEDEASLFSDTRVSHIFKINGAREYLDKLKEKTRIKDEIIKNLKEDIEFKNKELRDLQNRCLEAEKRSREYQKAWRDMQMARGGSEMEKKPSPLIRESSRILNRCSQMSSASSFTDGQVPPPPPVDVPTIDEILRSAPSPSGQISANMSFDSTIPPPPDIDVPLDELTQLTSDKRAFVQEQGQFVCHVYATVETAASVDTLSDVIELIENERDRSSDGAYQGWSASIPESSEDSRFHITLLRGHRAIYYHQITQLLECFENGCKTSSPFSLCLDKLSLFSNHENTRQFLCIASRPESDNSSTDLACFKALKQKLREAIDQFATRLTSEDETEDTLAHCSLMCRETQQVQSPDASQADLSAIENLCEECLDDYPMCLVKVNKIHVKIGKRTYEYHLTH